MGNASAAYVLNEMPESGQRAKTRKGLTGPSVRPFPLGTRHILAEPSTHPTTISPTVPGSGTAAVSQERRRLANARPARPRPKRERLAGSGTDGGGAETVKVLVSVKIRRVPLPEGVVLLVTAATVMPGKEVLLLP